MLEHLPARAATGGRVPCAVRGLRLVTTPQRNCRRVCAHRRPHWEGPPPDRPEEAFKVFCCDQDSSVLHQLNTDPRAAHVQVVHDPPSGVERSPTGRNSRPFCLPNSNVAWHTRVHTTLRHSVAKAVPATHQATLLWSSKSTKSDDESDDESSSSSSTVPDEALLPIMQSLEPLELFHFALTHPVFFVGRAKRMRSQLPLPSSASTSQVHLLRLNLCRAHMALGD